MNWYNSLHFFHIFWLFLTTSKWKEILFWNSKITEAILEDITVGDIFRKYFLIEIHKLYCSTKFHVRNGHLDQVLFCLFLNPYNYMIFEVFGSLFTFIVLLQKHCKTSPSYFNFCVAGLNLGICAEKEQARRSFTNTSMVIFLQGFKNK